MTPAPAIPPPAPEGAPPTLPELNDTLLDAAEVEQLLRDIELCAEVTGVIPKFAARDRIPDTAGITLAQARQLLTRRAVRALQLRYRYEDADWWDTLMLLGDQFRLVRIRHDFTADEGAGCEPDAAGPLESNSTLEVSRHLKRNT